MYLGNEPDERWDEMVALKAFYGTEWKIFVRDSDSDGRYVSVKLCAVGMAENKANYWLFWDREVKKLKSRSMDLKLLKVNRPELYNVVMVNLEAGL